MFCKKNENIEKKHSTGGIQICTIKNYIFKYIINNSLIEQALQYLILRYIKIRSTQKCFYSRSRFSFETYCTASLRFSDFPTHHGSVQTYKNGRPSRRMLKPTSC